MTIYKRKLVLLISAFVLTTIIGTITHELGHYAVARIMGYKAKMHFAKTSWGKRSYEKKTICKNERLFITSGGVAQTVFTGLVGLYLIFKRREKISTNGLKPIDWVSVFLSLFWLREPFNLFSFVFDKIIYPSNGSYFGGDEFKLSKMMGLHEGTFSIVLGVLGLVIPLYVFLKIIPTKLKVTFMIGGFVGCLTGYVLWIKIMGLVLMP